MESQQPEPVGDPPSYSEIAKHQAVEVPQGEEGEEKMNPKQPQYTWADPMSSSYPPAQPSQYPPTLTGPAPYGPAYGQPMFAYYQQPGYGMPYCSMATTSQYPQQQVMMVGGQQQHQPVLIQHVQSYGGYIVLSCIVTFCCNFILGFIAFVLARKQLLPFKGSRLYNYQWTWESFVAIGRGTSEITR